MKERVDSYGHQLPWSVGNHSWDVGSVFIVQGSNSFRHRVTIQLTTTGFIENPYPPDVDPVGKRFRLLRVEPGDVWVIGPLYPDHITLPDGI